MSFIRASRASKCRGAFWWMYPWEVQVREPWDTIFGELLQGLVTVLIGHYPTIGDIISNKYLKVVFQNLQKWDIYQALYWLVVSIVLQCIWLCLLFPFLCFRSEFFSHWHHQPDRFNVATCCRSNIAGLKFHTASSRFVLNVMMPRDIWDWFGTMHPFLFGSVGSTISKKNLP